MNEHIVTAGDCKNCKYCCSFSPEDFKVIKLLFTREEMERAMTELPSAKFDSIGDVFELRVLPPDADINTLYNCPFLDTDTGCVLGGNKPFSCKLWPFCAMKSGDDIAITIAPDCPAANGKSPEELAAFADRITPFVTETMEGHPDLLWEFDDNYPYLKGMKL